MSKTEPKVLKEYIDQVTDFTIELHKTNLSVFLENDKISQWAVGLATGGLGFFLSRIDTLSNQKNLVVAIGVMYGLILLCTLIQKVSSKAFTVAVQMRIMLLQMMNIAIKEKTEEFQTDLADGIFTCQEKFMDFGYLSNDFDGFKNKIILNERISSRISNGAFISTLFLFLAFCSTLFFQVL